MNSLINYVNNILFAFIPATRGWRLKRILLRFGGASIGKGVRVVSSCKILANGSFSVGDESWLGHELLVVGGAAPINIGAKVDIGPRVTLVTGTHSIDPYSGRAAGAGLSKPIDIADGVWIGAGAIILGGVSIGECSVVAAGAVVNRSVPPFCLVAGVPAKVVRQFDQTTKVCCG